MPITRSHTGLWQILWAFEANTKWSNCGKLHPVTQTDKSHTVAKSSLKLLLFLKGLALISQFKNDHSKVTHSSITMGMTSSQTSVTFDLKNFQNWQKCTILFMGPWKIMKSPFLPKESHISFFVCIGPWQLVTWKKFCFDVHELKLLEKVILSHITMHFAFTSLLLTTNYSRIYTLLQNFLNSGITCWYAIYIKNVEGIFENNIDGKKSTDRCLIPCLVVQAKSTGLFDRMAKMLRLNNVPIFLH